MKISQVKELVTKMFEEDDSLKYAIATNMAKYGRPDSRPGDKKTKLTKGLEKKREKHVLDLKKSMKEDDSFPGEPPSKGYMEARKLIDKLRATTFKKLNDDELYDFRKTIATAFDMSLRESEVSHGGQKGGAPIDLSEDQAEKMAALIKQRDALIKKHSDAGEMFSDKVYDLDSQIQKIAKSENLTEDINDDLKKIAKSLESQFDNLRFIVNYDKYTPERSRIEVYGTQQDLFDFGDKLHGKKFGEYEVFAVDDDERGEIVRIVKSDQIMRGEKKNPSMGIVRKKLGKVPKAGKVASKKKMKLPTGLINYMDYTIGEGHGLDQGDVDKIKALAKALRDGGDLSQDVGLRKDAIRIINFLIKSNIVQDKTKDLSKGKVDEKKKKKDDRCTRIAKRKYDTWPSAYASGAVVRCRKGEIWKKEK